MKVTVCGAGGGIGQPLLLLLKTAVLPNGEPLVSEIAAYDIAAVVRGVVEDVSHVCTQSSIKAFVGDNELTAALEGADIVLIPAGVPRKPGMTRDDLFNINAKIVKSLITTVGSTCPDAVIGIISNPVNSTVAIAAEVLKQLNVYNPKKLFGVTTLDIVRAKTFIAQTLGCDVKDVDVPVIGGHSGTTILPLLSQVKPSLSQLSEDDKTALIKRIQTAGTAVVEAKAGAGSATLSMAYAGLTFAKAIVQGLKGEPSIIACTMVETDIVPGCKFFACPVKLGTEGVDEVLGFGTLSSKEEEILKTEVIPQLQTAIDKGLNFAQKAAL